jgi:hypothetical protein
LELVEFRTGFLLKILFEDVSSILATFPKERTPGAYETIAGSNYVLALTTILGQDKGIDGFLTYQLLFPLSPASVIAHTLPDIGREEDTVQLMKIGNPALYSREIVWLMKQFFLRGSWRDEKDSSILVLELAGFLTIAQEFNEDERTQLQKIIIEDAVQQGMDRGKILNAYEDVTKNTPEYLAAEEALAPLKIPEVKTEEQARQVLSRIKSLHTANQVGYVFLNSIGEALAEMYGVKWRLN